jgi:hypothetical protein
MDLYQRIDVDVLSTELKVFLEEMASSTKKFNHAQIVKFEKEAQATLKDFQYLIATLKVCKMLEDRHE